MDKWQEKMRSINVGSAKRRKPKVTTDVHDTHTVDVTEHWEDRQDVNVKAKTVRARLVVEES